MKRLRQDQVIGFIGGFFDPEEFMSWSRHKGLESGPSAPTIGSDASRWDGYDPSDPRELS